VLTDMGLDQTVAAAAVSEVIGTTRRKFSKFQRSAAIASRRADRTIRRNLDMRFTEASEFLTLSLHFSA
jgi:hypothetical protein